MLECISDVLDWSEVNKVRDALAAAEFVDGKATAGFRAKRVKANEQLGREVPGRAELDSLILTGLRRNDEFQRLAIPRKIQRPLFSRYLPGMNYGLHVDDALMGQGEKTRTDLSVTVFLNQPDEYDGGELELRSPFGAQYVKLPAGAAVVYPSGALHQVMPVTRGERLAAVTWVQSYVKDATQREILFDLDRIRRRLGKLDPDGEETDLAFKTYANLLRMWSEL